MKKVRCFDQHAIKAACGHMRRRALVICRCPALFCALQDAPAPSAPSRPRSCSAQQPRQVCPFMSGRSESQRARSLDVSFCICIPAILV